MLSWMGQLLTKLFSGFRQEAKILLVGLDAAGKTSLLYKLKLGETVVTIPTVGFNVEQVQYRNVSFTVWDVGGQDRIRRLWRYYFQGVHAIIFVVDSADRERIEEARSELWKMLEADELKDAVVLVFANKQDLPNALSVSQVGDQLGLPQISNSRKTFCMGAVATQGFGLFEGLDWLSRTLNSSKV